MAQKRLLLITDDDIAIRRVPSSLLGKEDYRVLQAESGPETVDLAAAKLPDVILLDVIMPGLCGFEACRLLKARPVAVEAHRGEDRRGKRVRPRQHLLV